MNVIVIIADTVRHDYCGCYGNDWVQTPNIDALAARSAVMENFFAASFPTGPMRKDVYSGRFTFVYNGWQGDRQPEEVLLPEVLQAHGCRTAFVGDTSNSPQFKAGFDHDQVIPNTPTNIDQVPEEVELPADARKLRIPLPRIQGIARNARGWDGEEDRRAPRTMRAAHRWLEDNCQSTSPFFLYVDTFDPHEPWDPPRYYIDRYDPDYQGDELMEPAYERADYASPREIEHMRCMYAAKLTMVDNWIGHLLDGVERMGLLDDTAIIFTSDHGFYHGEHGLIGKVELSREGGVRGRWPLYSTISHPPFLLHVPGLTGGERHDAFCQPPDIMPTILELMGAPIPDRVQGQSLLPILRGEPADSRQFAVSSLTHIQDAEVRSPGNYRTTDYLYVYGGDEWPSELYDLRQDPDETVNIIGAHPDVARALHDEYIAFLESIDCPPDSLELRRPFNPTPRPNLPRRRTL